MPWTSNKCDWYLQSLWHNEDVLLINYAFNNTLSACYFSFHYEWMYLIETPRAEYIDLNLDTFECAWIGVITTQDKWK